MLDRQRRRLYEERQKRGTTTERAYAAYDPLRFVLLVCLVPMAASKPWCSHSHDARPSHIVVVRLCFQARRGHGNGETLPNTLWECTDAGGQDVKQTLVGR